MSYPVEASVDIGTEWNLEDIVPERIVITGWSRYRNRVEFRVRQTVPYMTQEESRYRNRVEFRA